MTTDSTATIPPAQRVGARRILLVDDADELRELYALALHNEGYEVRTAPLAEHALDIMRTWRPDLVFTDLFMPGMGGLEFITRLRSDFTPPVPPIVVVSGFPDVVEEALRRGAIRFETKPVSVDELLHITEEVLTSKQAPRPRAPHVIRERRNATRAIGEATLARYLTEDPGIFSRIDIQSRALARFFGHSSVVAFVLREGKLRVAGSSDPAFARDADAAEILPIVLDVVETGGSLVLTDGATHLLKRPHMGARFLIAVPFLLDRAVVGALCLVDRYPHAFDSTELSILEYLTGRGNIVMKGGARVLDDAGVFERDAFAAILKGSAQLTLNSGQALGFATYELSQAPPEGSLSTLFVNLPAPRMTLGVVDRSHVAAFVAAESVEEVRARLLFIRRDIDRRLHVLRSAELVFGDPIPRLELEGFLARAHEVLMRAEAEQKTFMAIDAVRR